MKRLLPILLSAAFVHTSAATAYTCPEASGQQPGAVTRINFVTSDIDLFWRAYDLATAETHAETFEREYLRKGSRGLTEFTRLRIGSAPNLAAAVKRSPKYYAGLRRNSMRVELYLPQMRAAMRCLKALYADAVIPDTYFLIGSMNSAGTADGKALYIGVDMFGKDGEDSLSELGAWHRAVIAPMNRIAYIVAHEAIHFQQNYPSDDTLLAAALREGIADFIGQMISGQHINPHLHAYGGSREREIWRAFEQEMLGTDLGNWLYEGDKAISDKPADRGYYVGYKIAEAYYRHQPDRKQAIRDMLNIRDFGAFLRASRYAQSFSATR